MHPILGVVLLLLPPTISAAQDVFGWQSLSQLNKDDKVRVSLIKGKSVTGQFQDWTAERLTVAGVTVKKDEVRKVERFRAVGRGRARRAGLAALIGFGGGFVFGAAGGGNCGGTIGPCLSRPAWRSLGAAWELCLEGYQWLLCRDGTKT